MKQKIVRIGSFASCHRISNHKGKCHNLHGHNYKYEIGFSYDTDNTVFSECNYAIDFGEIKKVYQHWIDLFFDHSVIVNENDTDVIELAKKINDPTRVLLSKGDPSVEVISQMLFALCKCVEVSNNVVKESTAQVTSIKIYETDSSYCEIDSSVGYRIELTEQFKALLDEHLGASFSN